MKEFFYFFRKILTKDLEPWFKEKICFGFNLFKFGVWTIDNKTLEKKFEKTTRISWHFIIGLLIPFFQYMYTFRNTFLKVYRKNFWVMETNNTKPFFSIFFLYKEKCTLVHYSIHSILIATFLNLYMIDKSFIPYAFVKE